MKCYSSQVGQSRHGDCLTVERASNTSLQFYGHWGHREGDGEKPGLEKYWAVGQNGKDVFKVVFFFFCLGFTRRAQQKHLRKASDKAIQEWRGRREHKYSKSMTGQGAWSWGAAPSRFQGALPVHHSRLGGEGSLFRKAFIMVQGQVWKITHRFLAVSWTPQK